jgi:CubicO group peptidase (beta-lactamase class C family)
VLQLLVEELTGRPFADHMQAEVLEPLGMAASSFRWSRTAGTARPHDAAGGHLPDFAFAEQAAAGLVTTAEDLARFLAAALAGPSGEPPGRGVLSPVGVRLALTAAPATEGRWGLGYGLGLLPPAATGSPTTRAPTAAGGRAWPCCPTGRQGSRCWPTATPQRTDRRRGPAVAGPRHAE